MMHKYHVTVVSSTPAAASQESSQVELTVSAERAKEILIMIILKPVLFLNMFESQWPLIWILFKSLNVVLFLEY